jgi:AcrR family transcriptional regulator
MKTANLPRGGADQKLLDAAGEMIDRTGISGLRLRDVAKHAGVNLGMFHYHFETKEKFVQRLLQRIYDDFFREFSLESQAGASPLARLRRALVTFGRFARDHRSLFIALMSEVLRGDKNCVQYCKTNIPRHAGVIADLILQCQQAGEIKNISVPVALSFVMGGMGTPNIAVSLIERFGSRRSPTWTSEQLQNMFLSDQAIEQRVDLVLSALVIEKGRKEPA